MPKKNMEEEALEAKPEKEEKKAVRVRKTEKTQKRKPNQKAPQKKEETKKTLPIQKEAPKEKVFCKKNYGRVQLNGGGSVNLSAGEPVLDGYKRHLLEKSGIEFEDSIEKCDG